MEEIQFIACVNNAEFVMNFSIRWLDKSGEWHTSEWNSHNYPIDQTRKSPDLAKIGVPDDARAVTPYVHAILGKHNTGNPCVQYKANGETATYEVTGTADHFHVKLL